jgi:predicted phage terminase large subunit-like protein
MQEMRFLGTSHKEALAVRDNLKARRLIQSDWFQKRWPTGLLADQNMKTKFENDKTGFREAMAFASMTGSRGDRVILDDPLSADDANSEVELMNAQITFLEALPTRVNNDESAIVVIMQRLHESDTTGVILSKNLPYVHLVLPMRFEEERRCFTVVRPTWQTNPSPVLARRDRITGSWYRDGDFVPEEREEQVLASPPVLVYMQDTRESDGDLLFEERFPEKQVRELEKTLGSYASAGQLQQRPTPRGGGLFKREWFKRMDAVPSRIRAARGWDLAATPDEEAAATAGVLMLKTVESIPRYIIADVKHERLSAAGVEALLRITARDDEERWGRGLRGSLPQDPGQAGKSQIAALLAGPLLGRNYGASPESGDKTVRALPLAAQAEAGNVYYLPGSWVEGFLSEAENFPAGKFKDQIDAAARAFNVLTKQSTWYSPEIVQEAYS